MSLSPRYTWPALVAVLLLLAGCGGLDEDGKVAADRLSSQFQDGGLRTAEADCLAKGWVESIGTDGLVKAGILTKDLATSTDNDIKPSRKLVEAYADAYFDCVDYGRDEAQKFESARPNIIDQSAFAACANKIDQDDAKTALVDRLLEKSSKTQASVDHQLLECSQVR